MVLGRLARALLATPPVHCATSSMRRIDDGQKGDRRGIIRGTNYGALRQTVTLEARRETTKFLVRALIGRSSGLRRRERRFESCGAHLKTAPLPADW
jgi:hypothetical protein